VRGAAAYSATLLSIGTAYLAACLAALLAWPLARGAERTHPLTLLVLALGLIGIIAVHPAVIERVLSITRRITRRPLELEVPSYGMSLAILAMQLGSWLAIGTGTWLVASALGIALAWPVVVLATSVSWVIGFLVLPVPGGIGIREGAFVAVLGGSADAAAIALTSRFIPIAVDLVGAGVATLVTSQRGTSPPPAPADTAEDTS
jgi:uncharacterized membrane protein YbhN (UPF0104 family)